MSENIKRMALEILREAMEAHRLKDDDRATVLEKAAEELMQTAQHVAEIENLGRAS